MPKFIIRFLFIVSIFSIFSCNQEEASKASNLPKVAQRPPMGWNSFDAWDCRIDEETFLNTVDAMDAKLKTHGWEYAVMDYIWWHPEPGHWNVPEKKYRRVGHPNVRYKQDGTLLNPDNTTIDEFGRLLPATQRFPSAKRGKGFKEIADYIHARGMKFGLHIMRGIPRAAVINKLPIKGTNYTADMIAEPEDTCRWNNHMFGIDPDKEGAQAYYNSIFELYAEWGVDYIKADDILYPAFHKREVKMIKRAIENSGRPMVLSLSPGEAHLGSADFLKEHANMWRISADFWDKWKHLRKNFELLNAWSSHTGPGSWPDADMIPFGHISLENRPHGPDRMSEFTKNEHYTLMSLWAIARSPLMIGADLLSSPDSILDFFTNDEIIYVNQYSENGHQARNEDNQIVWVAEDQNSDDIFIGLFNVSDQQKEVLLNLDWESLTDTYQVRDLWEKKNLGSVNGKISHELGPHEGKLFRLTDTK